MAKMRMSGIMVVIVALVTMIIFVPILPITATGAGEESGCCPAEEEGDGKPYGPPYGPQYPMDNMEECDEGMEHTGEHMAEEGRCMKKAEKMKMFGKFTMDGNNVSGRFVRFVFNEGIIEDLEVYDGDDYVKVFESIQVENFTPVEVHIEGALFWVNGTNAKIRIHNNPSAVLQIINHHSGDGFKVTYIIAENITINAHNNSARTYTLEIGNIEGYIITPFDTVLKNNTVTVETEKINSTGHSLFMVIPEYIGKGMAYRAKIARGIMDNKISGEIEIVGNRKTHAIHKITYRAGLEFEVKEMEKNRVRIKVRSDQHEGTCIIIRIGRDSLEMDRKNTVVKLDGKNIKRTTLDDVLLGGNEAKYSIYEGGNDVIEVAMYIPSFSEREVTVEKSDSYAWDNNVVLYIIIAIAIALVASIAVKLMKK